MLILAARLPWVALRSLRGERREPLDTCTMDMRVWPNDLDLYLHMNNGRYQTVMDLGRTDWAGRTGLLQAFWKRRWQPVAASAAIRYRRPLGPWQRYQLHTRLAGWQDRWFYFEQWIEDQGREAARAFVKVTILDRSDGRRSPLQAVDVVEAVGWGHLAVPDPPDGLAAWLESSVS